MTIMRRQWSWHRSRKSYQRQGKTFTLEHAKCFSCKQPNERNEPPQGRLPGRRLPIRRCGPSGAEILGLQRPRAARVFGSNSSSGAACRRLHSYAVEACRLRRLAAGGGQLGSVHKANDTRLTRFGVPESFRSTRCVLAA